MVKVDPAAPLETLAPLGCGVQTGVGAVWNVLKPGPGSTVVVAGAGAVGLSAVMAAALTPALRIIAVDVVAAPARPGPQARRHPRRRRLDRGLRRRGSPRSPAAPAATASSRPPATCRCCASRVDSLAARGTAVVVGAPPFGTEVGLDVNGMLGGKHRHRHHPRRQRDPDLHPAARRDGRRRPAARRRAGHDLRLRRHRAGGRRRARAARPSSPSSRSADPTPPHHHPPPGAQHMDITGKVAVVTGAGQGLGLAYAIALAEAGAAVVVNDVERRRRRRRSSTRSPPRAAGPSPRSVPVGTTEAAERLVAPRRRGLRPARRHGHQRRHAARPGAVEDDRRRLRRRGPACTCAGTFTCARAAAKQLPRAGRGRPR